MNCAARPVSSSSQRVSFDNGGAFIVDTRREARRTCGPGAPA
jgi:hypothetical protein